MDTPQQQLRRSWGFALLLVGAIAWTYGRVATHGFVNIDDDIYVTDNRMVKQGLTLESVRWAFANVERANYWHPLTWLSHMADVQCFGLRAGAHHLSSVALHALSTVILLLVLTRMTGAVRRSACVAGIFALHPLHVESVAWISERKDVLVACFWFLGLGAYTTFVRARDGARPRVWLCYVLTLLCFVLGLMSKPMIVTFPLVLLLLDVWPLGRFGVGRRLTVRAVLLEKLPFLVLAGGVSVATFWGQEAGSTLADFESEPAGWRIGHACVAYVMYLWKCVWPVELAVFYPHPGGPQPLGRAVGAALMLAVVTGIVLHQRRRMPFLAVGWVWYLITLLPVIGLISIGNFFMADRYTYVPMVGIGVMVVWGTWALLDRCAVGSCSTMLAWALAVAGLALCAVISRTQVGHWRDSRTLFLHAQRVTGENGVASDGLGFERLAAEKYDEAIPHLLKSIELMPGHARTWVRLGVCYAQLDRWREAEAAYAEATRINPQYAPAFVNMGTAYVHQGLWDKAEGALLRASELAPDDDAAQAGLGIVASAQGRLDHAVERFTTVVRLKPEDAGARVNLAIMLIRTGRAEAAAAELQAAQDLAPAAPGVLKAIGDGYAALGRMEEANAVYQQVQER